MDANAKTRCAFLPLFCTLVLCITEATRAQAPVEPLFTLKHIGPKVRVKWMGGARLP
jgi:hypothetical protein